MTKAKNYEFLTQLVIVTDHKYLPQNQNKCIKGDKCEYTDHK